MNKREMDEIASTEYKAGYFTSDGKFFESHNAAYDWANVLLTAEVIKELWQGRWGFDDTTAVLMAAELSQHCRVQIIPKEPVIDASADIPF